MLILALLSCAAATAQVHRCKDANGQTTLSDKPCGAAELNHEDARRAVPGSAVERIAAPQMASVRRRDLSAQYDFIPEQAGRAPAVRQSREQ